MGNGIGNQLPKSNASTSEKRRPEFKEIEVRMNKGESHKDKSHKAIQKRAKRSLCLTESGQFDEFVTSLLTPDNYLPDMFKMSRQKSDFNEWDIVGHVTRLNEVSRSCNKLNKKPDKYAGRRSSLLLDIEIL